MERVPAKIWHRKPHISLVSCSELWETDYAGRWQYQLRAQSFINSVAGMNVPVQGETLDGMHMRILPGSMVYSFARLLQGMMNGYENPYTNLHMTFSRAVNPAAWRKTLLAQRRAGITGNGEINNQAIINEGFLDTLD